MNSFNIENLKIRNHLSLEKLSGKASYFDEKSPQKKIFQKGKWLHFSIGERGRDQMATVENRIQVDGARGPISLERLLGRKEALLGKSAMTQVNTADHPADEFTQAAILTMQRTGFALERKRCLQLRRVEGAIERWRRGTYGHCVACQEPIETKRLKAVPETEFCLDCQKTLERKEHEYTH